MTSITAAVFATVLILHLILTTQADPECVMNSQCGLDKICLNNKCADPCVNVCGENAKCTVIKHNPICSCPPGKTGDPFINCTPIVSQACKTNADCKETDACIEFTCQCPCTPCGKNAECKVVDHLPLCVCLPGYVGNPFVSCKPECSEHSDCPPSKPACIDNSCKNLCDGLCDGNSKCFLLKGGLLPVCSCPTDTDGDSPIKCSAVAEKGCEPNPCGANAECLLGNDQNNKAHPVCACVPGYKGNPLVGCVKGE